MIIFSDLDNCLLDDNYTTGVAGEFIEDLNRREIAVAFISSKTCAEIEYLLEGLNIPHLFAAENGGLIVLEDRTFKKGINAEKIKKDLEVISKKTDTIIELYTQMKNDRLKELTDLPEDLLNLSKKRDFSQPFRILSGNKEDFINRLRDKGYRIKWGGRFYQITGNTSKAAAVRIIKKYCDGISVGLGDSPNDYAMLDECDYPIILNSEGHRKYRHYSGYGPEVWKEAVEEAIRRING